MATQPIRPRVVRPVPTVPEFDRETLRRKVLVILGAGGTFDMADRLVDLFQAEREDDPFA